MNDEKTDGGAPLERPVRPRAWGQRIDLDAQPMGFDRRHGDVIRWETPAVGLLYDQAALDAAVAAERERWTVPAEMAVQELAHCAIWTAGGVACNVLRDVLRA